MYLLVMMVSLVTLSYNAAAPPPPPACCPSKTVGGILYSLSSHMDTSSFNCLNHCVYTKVGSEGQQKYCFAAGQKEVECCDGGTDPLTGTEKPLTEEPEGNILIAESEVSDSRLTPVEGCPSEIPITKDGKIVAGKIYYSLGNDLPELSCNGGSGLWYAETKYTSSGGYYTGFGSVIINPGCTLIVFKDYNYAGSYKKFIGPQTIPNPPTVGPIAYCGSPPGPCVSSLLWTCKQTYPSCIADDKWQYVTELDNSAQSVTAHFTYEKTVGTYWSQSMKESQSVSATVSAEISASFWGATAKLGVSATTGYDWTSTSASEIQSYTVEVTVPPKTKVIIMEVLGYCGDSKIYTQMFRVVDTINNVTLRTYHGAITSYDLTT